MRKASLSQKGGRHVSALKDARCGRARCHRRVPAHPGSSCPGDRGSPASEGSTRLLLRSSPAPSEPGSRSVVGRLQPPPTCSTKALGQIVKPRSAAGPRDSRTAAASSLGLCRVRGSVREAPRRTSPKQRKGDLQKWLRDRTAGDAASSSARGPLGPARGLGSGGLHSQQPRPRCQVAIEASRYTRLLRAASARTATASPRGAAGIERELAPLLVQLPVPRKASGRTNSKWKEMRTEKGFCPV